MRGNKIVERKVIKEITNYYKQKHLTMKFKIFATPLAASLLLLASCSEGNDFDGKSGTGALSPEFDVNYAILSSRTITRATETASKAPEIGQFTFEVIRDDGKIASRTYTGLEQLQGEQFPVGAYTIEASYGSADEEGVDKAYYFGTASFNIYDGETATPSLTATLANTAVSIEYTDAFKKYFTAYKTTVHSSNGTKYIEMSDDADEWVYLKPGDLTFDVEFTKQNGVSGTMEAAKISNAQARTHYKLKVDVNGGEVGNEKITISFDDATETEPVTIDVSDDVINAPAPQITASGFTSGTAINILEGDDYSSALKTSILAMAGLSEVHLSISSPTPALSTVQGDIDLMAATDEQKSTLTAAGLTVKGLWSNPDKLAVIDFSGLMKNLKVVDGVSTHTFTLQVKDKYSKVSDVVTLTVNAPAPILSLSNPSELTFGQNQVEFDIAYNGNDIENKVKFQANNKFGNFADCTYASTPTSLGDNKYHVVLNIPESEEDVTVKAIYNNTTSNILTIKREAKLIVTGEVWANSATIQLTPLSRVSSVASITLNGAARSESFSSTTGKITFSGLTDKTSYTAKVTFSDGSPELEATFTTEEALAVPNGDFETLTQTINISSIQQGGTWSNNAHWTAQTTYASYDVSEPNGWASVNAKTCCTSAKNQNTWFVVPSTFNTSTAQNGSNAMTLRNVGWDLNGSTPGRSSNWSQDYSVNAASVANRAAGKLFLGSYSFDSSSSSETYTEGTSFTSRPATLKGYYKYTCDGNDATETGVVEVELLNGSTVIGSGSGTFTPATDFTQFSVAISYTDTALKATTLKIMFSSSNHKGDISAETSAIKTTNYMSESEQVTRGAELTVDNLTFEYK